LLPFSQDAGLSSYGTLDHQLAYFLAAFSEGTTMKRVASIVTAIVVCFGALQAAPDSDSDKPQYTSDNKLLPAAKKLP